MKCPNCNAIVLNSLETCPNCGNVLSNKEKSEPIVQEEQPIEQPAQSEPVVQEEQPIEQPTQPEPVVQEEQPIEQPAHPEPIVQEEQATQVNNDPKNKVNIVKCIAIPLLISVILFFITTITKLIINPDMDSKILSIVQISLPVLVLILGPIIMYVIQVNKK